MTPLKDRLMNEHTKIALEYLMRETSYLDPAADYELRRDIIQSRKKMKRIEDKKKGIVYRIMARVAREVFYAPLIYDPN